MSLNTSEPKQPLVQTVNLVLVIDGRVVDESIYLIRSDTAPVRNP